MTITEFLTAAVASPSVYANQETLDKLLSPQEKSLIVEDPENALLFGTFFASAATHFKQKEISLNLPQLTNLLVDTLEITNSSHKAVCFLCSAISNICFHHGEALSITFTANGKLGRVLDKHLQTVNTALAVFELVCCFVNVSKSKEAKDILCTIVKPSSFVLASKTALSNSDDAIVHRAWKELGSSLSQFGDSREHVERFLTCNKTRESVEEGMNEVMECLLRIVEHAGGTEKADSHFFVAATVARYCFHCQEVKVAINSKSRSSFISEIIKRCFIGSGFIFPNVEPKHIRERAIALNNISGGFIVENSELYARNLPVIESLGIALSTLASSTTSEGANSAILEVAKVLHEFTVVTDNSLVNNPNGKTEFFNLYASSEKLMKGVTSCLRRPSVILHTETGTILTQLLNRIIFSSREAFVTKLPQLIPAVRDSIHCIINSHATFASASAKLLHASGCLVSNFLKDCGEAIKSCIENGNSFRDALLLGTRVATVVLHTPNGISPETKTFAGNCITEFCHATHLLCASGFDHDELTLNVFANDFTLDLLKDIKTKVSNPYLDKAIASVEKLIKKKNRPKGTPTDDVTEACIVCLTNLKEYAMVPCGHLIACPPCAVELEAMGKCSLCQQPITATMRIIKS
jgi:hypothetical protein